MENTPLFPVTHWSLVQRAGAADEAARRAALQSLLERYCRALNYFLFVTFGLKRDEAEEILQSFIMDQVLIRQLVARADKTKGRFRTFLMTSLRNYTISKFRAAKDEPSWSDFSSVAEEEPNSDVLIQASWVRTLLNTVVNAMKEECQASGRDDIWQVFEERVLLPIFSQALPPSYEDLTRRLRLSSPTQAANLLITGKRMYARLLRTAIGEYELEPQEIDSEIKDLWKILSEAPAFQEPTTME